MSVLNLPKKPSDRIEDAAARVSRFADSDRLLANMGPSTVHSEMFKVILEDNAILLEEMKRLREENMNLKMQRRLENVRELEAQFPRKGRRRRASI